MEGNYLLKFKPVTEVPSDVLIIRGTLHDLLIHTNTFSLKQPHSILRSHGDILRKPIPPSSNTPRQLLRLKYRNDIRTAEAVGLSSQQWVGQCTSWYSVPIIL